MVTQTNLFAYGSWRTATNVYVNQQGSWTQCNQVWVNQQGTWRLVFQKAFSFNSEIPSTVYNYTRAGTYSFTVPSNTSEIIFNWIVGAGGGGGGGTQNNNGGGGGGGGSGGYLQSQVLSVNQGDTITIVVGAGGAAQTVANNTSPGGTGGTTTVSQNGAVQFTVTGGAGGLYATSNGGGFGGAGGSPNGAAGGEGGHGTSDTSSDSGGAGGSTPFGQGGAGGAGTAGAEHGSNGSGPGGGGGGGGDADRGGAGDDGLGGNGADGGVEIVSFGVALSGATAVANPDSYNLLTAIQATGQWDGVTPVSATVLCGGAQVGTNSTTPAFSTGSLPANSSLTLTINSGCSINGTSGGAALNIQCPTTIINNGSINGPIIGSSNITWQVYGSVSGPLE
jgi:hypothetical protein